MVFGLILVNGNSCNFPPRGFWAYPREWQLVQFFQKNTQVFFWRFFWVLVFFSKFPQNSISPVFFQFNITSGLILVNGNSCNFFKKTLKSFFGDFFGSSCFFPNFPRTQFRLFFSNLTLRVVLLDFL